MMFYTRLDYGLFKSLSQGEIFVIGSNVSDETKNYFRARGFGVCAQKAFIDVRVFHPFAPSYRHKSPYATHRKQESDTIPLLFYDFGRDAIQI